MSSNASVPFNTTSIPLNFPVSVSKTVVFTAQNQEDLDYLNSTKQDQDFIADLRNLAEDISLALESVDGKKIE